MNNTNQGSEIIMNKGYMNNTNQGSTVNTNKGSVLIRLKDLK